MRMATQIGGMMFRMGSPVWRTPVVRSRGLLIVLVVCDAWRIFKPIEFPFRTIRHACGVRYTAEEQPAGLWIDAVSLLGSNRTVQCQRVPCATTAGSVSQFNIRLGIWVQWYGGRKNGHFGVPLWTVAQAVLFTRFGPDSDYRTVAVRTAILSGFIRYWPKLNRRP